MATSVDREVFLLGQSGRFALPNGGATMAMIVLSSPATLTGAGEKKTGPSRFIADFSSVTLDPIIQKLEGRRQNEK